MVAWKAHGRVVIEVRDDGSPIPEDMQESMFLPYRSTGARAGLTASVGLGLTVSSPTCGSDGRTARVSTRGR